MNRERLSTSVWTIPNLLTMARIFLVPLFFALLIYHYRCIRRAEDSRLLYEVAAVVTFLLILITDALDGYLARRNNQCTVLGSILDPVADKMFVISSFALLAAVEVIPLWLAVLVISKDVATSLGWLLLQVLHYDSTIKPSRAGRAALVMQFLVVLEGLVNAPHPAKIFLWSVTALLTLASTLGYIKEGLRRGSIQPQQNLGGNNR